MKDTSLLRTPIVLSMLLLGASNLSQATALTSETYTVPLSDFYSLGDAQWTTRGPVASASLRDREFEWDAPVDSSVWTVAPLQSGQYFLQFDLLSDLDRPDGQFSIPDFFQASLFFTNDLSTFNFHDSSSYSVTDLFLLDSYGPATIGTSGALTTEADRLRFTHSFESEYAYAIPYFVLFEMDFRAGNSAVDIEGLTLRAPAIPVSEPGSGLLLAMGLIASFMFRSRKLKSSNAK